jgi:phage terminase large subunit-like protein
MAQAVDNGTEWFTMVIDERSVAEQLADLSQDQLLAVINDLTPEQQKQMLFDWSVWRRPKQKTPDGHWRVWLIQAGRGFGKTRTGAETFREQVNLGLIKHGAIVGRTASDVRDTMIEGESGLLRVFPADERPRYEPSKRRLTFKNGAQASTYSADEPDRLRGPNHDFAWADELAAWRYKDAWDQLMFGLRIGAYPRCVVTTTPRPVAVIKDLLKIDDGSVVITRGSTYENVKNLAPAFIDEMRRRYEGTTLGRQELHAEVLDDVEGALWQRITLDQHRVVKHIDMKRIVVAVDPAVTSRSESNETGIIVAGIGLDGHGYVLDDKTMRGSPDEWGRAAVSAYHHYKADRIVAESNQGGDMVRHTLATVDRHAPVKLVHASRGKRTRAEPVAALYEQGKIHHVGYLPLLEDQLCGWIPDVSVSPDRLDALVWAFTDLMIDGARSAPAVVPISISQISPWKVS